MWAETGPRLQIARMLPLGGVGVEIGVAEGGFSAMLLDQASPKKLYLVDAWKYQNIGGYEKDPCNVGNCQQDIRYKLVCKTFKDDKRVEIIRSLSIDAATMFEDEYFDWIYLDACHTFECVMEDLVAWWPKLKRLGIFSGHDYCMRGHVEVKLAVDTFLEDIVLKVQLVTKSMFPDWLVQKK